MVPEKKNIISFRVQVSIILILLAFLAMILPDRSRSASGLNPAEILSEIAHADYYISCDKVARSVIYEDPTIQLIDLRSKEEYLKSHIPSAINIPLEDIVNPDWSGYLSDPERLTILYSDGNTYSSAAYILCERLGYSNIRIMDGGMNRWFQDIMESEFSGDKITSAENALYEVRYRARDYYTKMNSLPDSLKTAFLEVKRKKEADLVGGCE